MTALAGLAVAGLGSAQAHAAAQAPAGRPAMVPATAAASPALSAAHRTSTRAGILARAQAWVDAGVPYSGSAYYQGYRTDCSGFVSMAWGLGESHWTGDLDQFGVRITKEELQPGDMLLFHNPADPSRGSHAVLFAGWADQAHTRYTVMEETSSRGAVKRTAPYAYFSHSSSYVPYRYKDLGGGGGGEGQAGTAFPGAGSFGPGARNAYVTRLGSMLVARGGGRFYREGPGPGWGAADEAATRAFQQAQGWSGGDADGIPGAGTWRLLVEGRGNDIGAGEHGGGRPAGRPPEFPGASSFGPGRTNPHVTLLGQQLVSKGFGQAYASGPGPVWSACDRRAVEAFQRAQGWRGADADGYPGAHTWRLLFS